MEEACRFACQQHLMSLSQIKSILATQADKAPLVAANDSPCLEKNDYGDTPPHQHRNLRGADYYS